jgi:hypothetical protein
VEQSGLFIFFCRILKINRQSVPFRPVSFLTKPAVVESGVKMGKRKRAHPLPVSDL